MAILHSRRMLSLHPARQRCAQLSTVHRERRATVRMRAQQGGMGDEDMDMAVFRFTLGIPGFEDRMIPRVVSYIGGAALVINHVISGAAEAQARAEGLCGALVLLLFLVPEIEERIREAQPGRGRVVGSGNVDGSTNAFLLASELADAPKQELAWSSFVLIKNTNSCGVVLESGGKALMARGALGSASVTPGKTDQSLAAITQSLAGACSASSELSAVKSGAAAQLWLPDRAAIEGAGLGGCMAVPSGAQSLLAQHVGGAGGQADAGLLLLFSERPRALSERERKWAAAIASKLSGVL